MRYSVRLFVATLFLSASSLPASAADALGSSSSGTPATTRAAEQLGGKLAAVVVESPLIADAPLSTDFVMGDPNAPITMVEYASLTCPHCAHFHSKFLPTLKEKFIDTGKMKYVLRPYPLNEPALKASILVDCIGEKQGSDRYYLFARVLFDSQSKWAFEGNYMGALETFASVGGIDQATFNSCIGDPERELKILKTKKEANDELKIPHTPFFFIDGRRYEGDRSIEGFVDFIQERLDARKK